ncbi:DNA mismatch endonuclease Vsr [Methylobacterium sp. WL12]|uniref:very short patch repair endonuclease n=1 Tax=Methylobacterium sp. WL12 TaxID=2603890 RepID=UPI0011C9F53C|nr:very short patch repair endonuclease [Methylobacterium sp. WL12]TXM66642.1 DNA mismatch endonuclease Vsr [Methylobacterium sp. WL12]
MDRISTERRSANMRAIRSSNTKPEILVRVLLREIGFPGYRLHKRNLPGKPDIVFVGRKKAIFVHGCFWHGHDCAVGIRRPTTRPEYWLPKISGNQERDARKVRELCAAGWDVLTIWECQTRDLAGLKMQLASFLGVTVSAQSMTEF